MKIFGYFCIAWSSVLIAGANADLEPDVAELESITVYGTKANKPYFETTESVSILGTTDVPGGGRENSLQVLNAVPGVQVHRDGESFGIRGINSTGVTGYQKDNLASVVVDGLFQTDLAIEAGSFHLWDLDWIEVLRGAQSTNQGINSLAGTILLQHQRADAESRSGAARLGISSLSQREAAIAANESLAGGRLGLRLNYAKERNGGFVTNTATANDEWGGWDRDRARVAVVHPLGGRGEIELDVKFHRNHQGGTYVQSDDPFRYEVSEDQDVVTKTRNIQSGLRYRRDLGEGISHEGVLGASDTRQAKTSDADGTAAPTAGIRHDRHDDRYYSAENIFRMKRGRWNHFIGFHAHHFALTDDYAFNLLFPVGAAATPVALRQAVERSRRTFSLFDSTEYRVGDHTLSAGVRLEHVRNRYGTSVDGRRTQDLGAATNTFLDNYLASVSGAYSGAEGNLTALPRLAYQFMKERHTLGASYARAYRTGGVAINRRRTVAVEYAPEYTNNYELSYKLRGDGFRLSTNLFYIDWRAQQVQVQLSNDFYDTQVANAASSRVLGGEIETRVDAGSGHAVHFGAGYSDTRFRDFTSNGVDYSGNSFPLASKVTARISHEAQIVNPLMSLLVARYVSSGFTDAENIRRSDAQFYVDWNLRYLAGSWVAEAYANNLLDGKFLLFNGAPTSATSPYPSNTHRTNSPRETGVRVTRYW